MAVRASFNEQTKRLIGDVESRELNENIQTEWKRKKRNQKRGTPHYSKRV